MPTLRVAYVNTEKLLNSYQAMVSARRVYQGEKQEWEHNLETLAHEARQAQEARQRLGSGASAGQQAASDEILHLKQQQFLNYRAAVQQQNPAEMQRLTQPVVAAANRCLAIYSKQQQYELVLSAVETAFTFPSADTNLESLSLITPVLENAERSNTYACTRHRCLTRYSEHFILARNDTTTSD